MDETTIGLLCAHIVQDSSSTFLKYEQLAEEAFDDAASQELMGLQHILSTLISILAFHLRTPLKGFDEKISYQLAICCSFHRSQRLVWNFLRNGNVQEGVTLLRRQAEQLARAMELDIHPIKKLSGKTPNIGVLLKGAGGRLYGELSQIAHFADSSGMDLLAIQHVGNRVGPNAFPAFHRRAITYWEIAHYLAIEFCIWLQRKLFTWHPDMDFAREIELAGTAIAIAKDIGILACTEAAEG